MSCYGSRSLTLHPNTSRPIPQSELDTITIETQRVLILQLERRLRDQQECLQVLEMLVGYEKLGLQAEIENLRRSLRERTA